jgi:hypothetical protein
MNYLQGQQNGAEASLNPIIRLITAHPVDGDQGAAGAA